MRARLAFESFSASLGTFEWYISFISQPFLQFITLYYNPSRLYLLLVSFPAVLQFQSNILTSNFSLK